MTGWGTHLQDLMAAGVLSWEERELRININSTCFECLLSQDSRRVGHSHEQHYLTGGLSEEARGHYFQDDVQSGARHRDLHKTALGDFVRDIHSREERHPIVPVELPRPNPFHQLISSSSGVQCHLRGVRSSSYGLVCYKRIGKLLL